MPVEISHQIRPGIWMYGVSSTFDTTGPAVVIPIQHLAILEDIDIGKYARELIPIAERAKALSIADWIVSNGNDAVPESLLEEYAEDFLYLERFAGQASAIDQALACIRRTRTRIAARKQAPQVRRDLQAEYAKTFLKIGRRDGFQCRQCRATSDLQIDHLVAVSNGGSNELPNLQLLCKPCNCKKGARDNVP